MASATDRLDLVADDIRWVHRYLADGEPAMAKRAISLAIVELAQVYSTIED